MMILHLRSLDNEALARKVYEHQKEKQWPGLADEAKKICKELAIEDVNTTKMSKKEFKEMAKQACLAKYEEYLRKLANKRVNRRSDR